MMAKSGGGRQVVVAALEALQVRRCFHDVHVELLLVVRGLLRFSGVECGWGFCRPQRLRI
jgi:hypothetical protein